MDTIFRIPLRTPTHRNFSFATTRLEYQHQQMLLWPERCPIPWGGCKPPTDFAASVRNYRKSDIPVDLRLFRGILSHYLRFIPFTEQHQNPFNELHREPRQNDSRKVPWIPAAESAFEKTGLAFSSISKRSTRTRNRSSDVAIGASLEQKCDGHLKPLGFFFTELTSTETRHCTCTIHRIPVAKQRANNYGNI